MTASEFLEQWQDFNESPNFVRYPLGVMASFGVTEADQLFLMEAGLPAFATPHLWFFWKAGESLPPPVDPYGGALALKSSGMGMIGSTAEGWPIYLDGDRPGQILCLRLDSDLFPQLLNSSFRQLAACLIAYDNAVELALADGASRGIEDAWRKRDYPSDLDAQHSGKNAGDRPRRLFGRQLLAVALLDVAHADVMQNSPISDSHGEAIAR